MTIDIENSILPSDESTTISMIDALRRQEARYVCCDYCVIHDSPKNIKTLKDDRKLMVKWCYNVLDFFHLNRETAAIAMSYVDRFLFAEPDYLQDTDKYQLLCIVALYVAIKVHEPKTLSPDAFVDIGRGQFSADDMVQLESKLLCALAWQVNPPTAIAFVRSFLELAPSRALDPGIKATMFILAKAQTEMAVGDYNLVTVAPSRIALAALENALEALGYCYFPLFLDDCALLFSEEFLNQEVKELRPLLKAAINSVVLSKTLSTSSSVNPKCSNTITGDMPSKTHSSETFLESTTPRSVVFP